MFNTEPDGRDVMQFDIVVVGAGPAGLATSIRLKQLVPDLQVVVLEKGAEVGAHILSGAVIDPIGLDRLLPGWRDESDLFAFVPVTDDRFHVLTRTRHFRLPGFALPRLMSNHGNFIVSLGQVCRWLAGKAEALGVEIYPGFAVEQLFKDPVGTTIGVITSDMGLDKSGAPGPNYQRGAAITAKYVVIAEGVRGSLAREAIEAYGLADEADHQKYGIGFKELWQVPPAQCHPGRVEHSFGWPLDNQTGGGSYLYHLEGNKVAVGFVVHLNYRNPYLSPFEEFQRFKTHPAIAAVLNGGERLAYGSRAISEGGWQSVPRLAFPGGVIAGDSAGFVNVPRIKGSHNAILSGLLAAEKLGEALQSGRSNDVVASYDAAWRDSDIGHDLKAVRNVKPLWSRLGTILGIAAGGIEMWCQQLFGTSPLGTLGHSTPDHLALQSASQHRPIAYPKPDGRLSFDRLSSVFLSGTNHQEQPSHLRLSNPDLQLISELDIFGGPSTRYCPAGVYEWLTPSGEAPRFVINAQNCVHCKTCDIKDPNQNIRWRTPQGGDGPNYQEM